MLFEGKSHSQALLTGRSRVCGHTQEVLGKHTCSVVPKWKLRYTQNWINVANVHMTEILPVS